MGQEECFLVYVALQVRWCCAKQALKVLASKNLFTSYESLAEQLIKLIYVAFGRHDLLRQETNKACLTLVKRVLEREDMPYFLNVVVGTKERLDHCLKFFVMHVH